MFAKQPRKELVHTSYPLSPCRATRSKIKKEGLKRGRSSALKQSEANKCCDGGTVDLGKLPSLESSLMQLTAQYPRLGERKPQEEVSANMIGNTHTLTGIMGKRFKCDS